MVIPLWRLRVYPASVLAVSLMGSIFSPVIEAAAPTTQNFLITAYYSPVPDQCCYARGSYEADVLFNGWGERGADMTPVYPGMLAAPKEYSFGTRMDLESIGVGTVHDRGGRIVATDDTLHRLDIWMGVGEQGLAAAMNWGARKVSGTVYEPGSANVPKESISLEKFTAPLSVLAGLPKTDTLSILANLKAGDQKFGVYILQQLLATLSYLDRAPTGTFGPETAEALKKFQTDAGIQSAEPKLDQFTRAVLMTAASMDQEGGPDLHVGLRRGMRGSEVRDAQKALRYLGYYRGRTSGVFDPDLKDAVFAFQLSKEIVQDKQSSGAGIIGPQTKKSLLAAWRLKQAQTEGRIALKRSDLEEELRTKLGKGLTLAKGDGGAPVNELQNTLATLGYFEGRNANGHFGAKTQIAVLKYQLSRKIIGESQTKGAGVIGPVTKQALIGDAVKVKLAALRAGTR